jgi:hypothetical protein
VEALGASGDDIASISRLLSKRWQHRRISRGSPSMPKPTEQSKPLNDLSLAPHRSILAQQRKLACCENPAELLPSCAKTAPV